MPSGSKASNKKLSTANNNTQISVFVSLLYLTL